MSEPEPSDLWDRWSAARRREPSLEPEQFVRSLGSVHASAFELLRSLIEIERQAEPSPLVDIVDLRGPTRFAGFRIMRSLGQGSSGVVFLAIDEREGGTGGEVALKILNPLLAAAPERRDSILREARIAEKLDHEGIVRVLASGVERGYAWIATEHVEGEPLGATIDTEAVPEERARRAIEIGLQLARALQHAHERGVIHRDLKPANVMLTPDGRVKILDFGLARAEGTAFAVSRTGEAVGTPLYMAPEQWRGDAEIGPCTDVFAVGLILWEIASGQRLAADGNLRSMLKQIASGRRRVSRSMLNDLPLDLAEIVLRSTESHPHDRYASCAKLGRDLLAALEGRDLPIGALPRLERLRRTCVHHPIRCAAIGGGVPSALLLLFYVWWTWPVAVYIDVHPSGNAVLIGGESVGNAPVSRPLRPGRYSLNLGFGGYQPGTAVDLIVEPRTPQFRTYVLEPQINSPLLDRELSNPGARVACLLIATPHDTIDLEVDGRMHAAVPGITRCFLPYGIHRVRVSAKGRISEERSFEINTCDMRFVAAELEPEGSAWRNIVLYSPIEQRVQDGIVRTDGLRPFVEEQPIGSNEPVAVEKMYWGAMSNLGRCEALVRIDLPFAIDAIDLAREEDLSATVLGADSWTTLELGSSANDLHVVQRVRRSDGSPPEARIPEEELNRDELTRLPQRLRGSTQLLMRLTAGGGEVGDAHSYASVLRTNAMPYRWQDGVLHWRPALTLRVRRAP